MMFVDCFPAPRKRYCIACFPDFPCFLFQISLKAELSTGTLEVHFGQSSRPAAVKSSLLAEDLIYLFGISMTILEALISHTKVSHLTNIVVIE